MQSSLTDLELKFCRFLYEHEPIEVFEEWLYACDDLEQILGADDYLTVISLDFSKPVSRQALVRILSQYVDEQAYQLWRIRQYLTQIVNGDGDLGHSLSELYQLYCQGFRFLKTLSLTYGLTIAAPPREFSSSSFAELTAEEQRSLLSGCVPGAQKEAERVLEWLNKEESVMPDEFKDVSSLRDPRRADPLQIAPRRAEP